MRWKLRRVLLEAVRSRSGDLKRVGLVLLLLAGERRGRVAPLAHLACLAAVLLLDLVARRVAGRHPLCRVPRLAVGVVVHGIDVLESEVGGFVDKEVGDERVGQVASGEDKAVGKGGERRLLGTGAVAEALADPDPDTGSPGGGVSENEEARRDDEQVADALGDLVGLGTTDDTGDGKDEEPERLPSSTVDQRPASTEALEDVETEESAGKVDGAEDDLSDERVAQADRGEDGSAKVEEVVGTGELLAGLQRHAEQGSVERLVSRLEAVDPAGLLHSFVGLDHGDDLAVLGLDPGVAIAILGATHRRARLVGLFVAASGSEPTGRLRAEENADGEDRGKEDAEGDGHAPLARVAVVAGADVGAIGQQNAEGDEKLVGTDEGTSDLARHSLGLVEGHGGGKGANTETGDEPTDGHLVPGGERGDLDDDTNVEDDALDDHGPSSTERVSQRSADHDTDGRSHAEERDDDAFEPRVPVLAADRIGVVDGGEALTEVGHLGETGNLTRVPAEEEATHGGEHGDEEGEGANRRASHLKDHDVWMLLGELRLR
ncbi:hypothetical protein L1887_54076 [Cichorium endivia]|nr:hypothetical protein L1887_54076 [Cichorium endivia]